MDLVDRYINNKPGNKNKEHWVVGEFYEKRPLFVSHEWRLGCWN